MKRSVLKHAITALAMASSAALSAHADVINFEDVVPNLGLPSYSSGGYDFASGGTGFSGVDNATAFSLFANAPTNSSGQFLFALNNDELTMSQGGASFRLQGFDFAFVPPVQFSAGTSAGRLVVEAMTAGGLITDEIDFGLSGASGAWSFLTANTNALASGVTSVKFTACLYDGLGGCARDVGLSQFALDNMRVPEPGSVALTLAALGLLVATRRRQSL
jgi:PEP-CTERM motif